MLIIDQSGEWACVTENLYTIHAHGKDVRVCFTDSDSRVIGSYGSHESAKIAFDGLMRAADHGAKTWQMMNDEVDTIAEGLVDAGLVDAIFESLKHYDDFQDLRKDPDAVRAAIRDGINNSGIWRKEQ